MNPQLLKGGVAVLNDSFTLKVSKDKLNCILVPKAPGMVVDNYQKLQEEARGHGVVNGILPKLLPLKNGFVLAKGTPPENGRNATIKFHVKPSMVRAPKLKDPHKDQVDYRELGSIINVAKDQILLEKVAFTEGVPGKDVFGEPLKSKPGKDIKIKTGPGVTFNEDNQKVYSCLDGKFVMADGKASVFDEHVVSGDVDLSVGNINFHGKSLIINGEVQSGFKIRCRGDISIAKGMQNSSVIAGGNVTIKGGVIGVDSDIKAKGDISIDFAENGPRFEAIGSLYISDVAIQCYARTGKDVKAVGGKGVIIGGKYIVGGSVYAKELGSDAEVLTDITVGLNPVLEEKKRKLSDGQAVWPVKMNDLIKNTTGLKQMKKEMGKNFPEEKAQLLEKLNAMLPKVMEEVNKLTELEAEVNEELEQATNESVYVYGKVFPGVTVKIGNAKRTVPEEEKGVIILLNKKSLKINIQPMTAAERAAIDQK